MVLLGLFCAAILLLVLPWPFGCESKPGKWAPFRSRDVEDLAQLLHEAGAYTYMAETNVSQGEWHELSPYAQECRRSEARYLLCHVRIERTR